MKRNIWMLVAVVAAISLGYVAGNRRSSQGLTIPLVRTYQVPVDRADEIRSSLNKLFAQKDGEAVGSAQIFGNGLMLVRAPEGFQHGVERLIEELGKDKSPRRATVRVDFWLVMGTEDKTSNSDIFPALSAPLDSIAKLDGTRKFRVIEHLSTNSVTGQEVMVEGNVAKAMAVVNLNTDGLGLRLDFHSRLGQIKTDTMAKSGEFLVLGQNAVNPEERIRGEKLANAMTSNVYYIVRAELIH